MISSVTETSSSKLRVLNFEIGIDPAAGGFIFLCWMVNVLSCEIELPSSGVFLLFIRLSEDGFTNLLRLIKYRPYSSLFF